MCRTWFQVGWTWFQVVVLCVGPGSKWVVLCVPSGLDLVPSSCVVCRTWFQVGCVVCRTWFQVVVLCVGPGLCCV